ncbi:transcriptional regulator [Kaistia sp. 32K]|nr:transcriptional regulator [Kaistia sp. 32K]
MDWEDARYFAALARHGSLSAAARALAVNHATVARRVAGLEKALGARLIERRPTGYELTAAGRDALQAIAAMETAARSLARHGEAEAPAGLVRITATPGLADAYLLPRLALFRGEHPAIDIEMIADRRLVSLARREADLALRLGRPTDSELTARQVATLGFGFYASAGWAARIAAGAEPDLVGFDEASAHLPEAVWLSRRFPGRGLAFRTNSQLTQAGAARAGFGVALLPHFLARPDPALVAVDIEGTPPLRELWLLARRESAIPAPVRLVRDALVALFKREAALFRGNGAG